MLLELTENHRSEFEAGEIPADLALEVFRLHGTKVSVEWPSPKTGGRWQFTPGPWVGHLPLGGGHAVSIAPKIPLKNLFGMLEYAFRLKSFSVLEGAVDLESVRDFYAQLAKIFAARILDRDRRGLYRAYIPVTERLACVRGRLDLHERLRRPWDVRLTCSYQEHTADIEDNRILTWALYVIARSGLCPEPIQLLVRKAYRATHHKAPARPVPSSACLNRQYNRLNADYQILHALARLFLENTGPTLDMGDHRMMPFVVNTARLFELFVAEWLSQHLPSHLMLKAQERVGIGEGRDLHFTIDMVIYDRFSGLPLAVLDAKYKDPDHTAADDVAQVMAYSQARRCALAMLVYPKDTPKPLAARFGDVRVAGSCFGLGGDLAEAGRVLLEAVITAIGHPERFVPV